jgi:hypothetical protein
MTGYRQLLIDKLINSPPASISLTIFWLIFRAEFDPDFSYSASIEINV